MNNPSRWFSLSLPVFTFSLGALILFTLMGIGLAFQSRTSAAEELVVYKDPDCGCCDKWVDHMREHGFEVQAFDTTELRRIKLSHGIPPALHSCHTALVDGYVVEGHVPADLVSRLLRERPDVRGLAVPGMPLGSPGMEAPVSEPYDILSFQADGGTRVFDSR